MKILLIFLLSFSALAVEVEVRKQGESFYFRFQDSHVLYCWGLYQFTDLTYINDTWTTVQQTAIDRSWPAADAESIAVCGEPRDVWRTSSYAQNGQVPVYAVLGIPPVLRFIGNLQEGVICGELIMKFGGIGYQYRTVKFNNTQGLALCTLRTQ